MSNPDELENTENMSLNCPDAVGWQSTSYMRIPSLHPQARHSSLNEVEREMMVALISDECCDRTETLARALNMLSKLEMAGNCQLDAGSCSVVRRLGLDSRLADWGDRNQLALRVVIHRTFLRIMGGGSATSKSAALEGLNSADIELNILNDTLDPFHIWNLLLVSKTNFIVRQSISEGFDLDSQSYGLNNFASELLKMSKCRDQFEETLRNIYSNQKLRNYSYKKNFPIEQKNICLNVLEWLDFGKLQRNFIYKKIVKELFQIRISDVMKNNPESRCDLLQSYVEKYMPDVGSLRSIRVGGTNGKGSVCLKIAESLRVSGHLVGLFTSPHISNCCERIRVNNKCISRFAFVHYYAMIKATVSSSGYEGCFSFFDYLTLIALRYFRDVCCDWVLLEVGVGGQWDPTGLVVPEIGVITTIGYDHMRILGPTLEDIAKAKAGILTPTCRVVLGPSAAQNEVIMRAARQCHQPPEIVPFMEGESIDNENTRIAGTVLGLLPRVSQAAQNACRLTRQPARMEEASAEQLRVAGQSCLNYVNLVLVMSRSSLATLRYLTSFAGAQQLEKERIPELLSEICNVADQYEDLLSTQKAADLSWFTGSAGNKKVSSLVNRLASILTSAGMEVTNDLMTASALLTPLEYLGAGDRPPAHAWDVDVTAERREFVSRMKDIVGLDSRRIDLEGAHVMETVNQALQTLKYYFKKTRSEAMPTPAGLIVDAGHNADAIGRALDAVKRAFPTKRVRVVMSLSAGRGSEVLEHLPRIYGQSSYNSDGSCTLEMGQLSALWFFSSNQISMKGVSMSDWVDSVKGRKVLTDDTVDLQFRKWLQDQTMQGLAAVNVLRPWFSKIGVNDAGILSDLAHCHMESASEGDAISSFMRRTLRLIMSERLGTDTFDPDLDEVIEAELASDIIHNECEEKEFIPLNSVDDRELFSLGIAMTYLLAAQNDEVVLIIGSCHSVQDCFELLGMPCAQRDPSTEELCSSRISMVNLLTRPAEQARRLLKTTSRLQTEEKLVIDSFVEELSQWYHENEAYWTVL